MAPLSSMARELAILTKCDKISAALEHIIAFLKYLPWVKSDTTLKLILVDI